MIIGLDGLNHSHVHIRLHHYRQSQTAYISSTTCKVTSQIGTAKMTNHSGCHVYTTQIPTLELKDFIFLVTGSVTGVVRPLWELLLAEERH